MRSGGHANGLNKLGLLNKYTEDLGTISMGKRIEYQGFCDSNWCAGGNGKIVKIGEAIEGRHDNCPRCGRMLIWKRVKTNFSGEL